jgi:molecular chaperone GrpE
MAKKQKAKDKADIQDESIDSQDTLEEDDLLEEETDGSDEETVANQNADEKIKDLEEALLRSRAELDNAFKRNTADIEKAHKYGVERLLK